MVKIGVQPRIAGLATLLMALILAADLSIPRGVAGGLPYVAVVLLGRWLPRRQQVIALASLTTFLTIAGYFYSAAGSFAWMEVSNRVLVILVIWACALLVVQRKRQKATRTEGNEALEKSQSRLAEAQRLGRIGHFRLTLDPPSLEWSDQIYRHFGVEPGEFEPTPDQVRSLMHPDDLNAYLAALQEAVENKRPFSAESRFVRPDGRSLVLDFEAQPEFDQAGEVVAVFGVAQNITERKQVEAALRESERQLAEAQVIAKMGHFRTQLDPPRAEWSDEIYRIFGYAPGELEAGLDSALSLTHPDDRDRYLQARNAAIEHKQPFSVEHRFIRKDGKEISVAVNGRPEFDAAGEVVAVFGTIQDISERKQAEEELARHRDHLEELIEEQTAKLRQSEERFRDFAESASDWFWEMGPDLKFNYGSDRFYEITGWQRQEVYGRGRDSLVHPELEDLESEKWRDHFARLERREPFANFEYATRTKEGSFKYISLSGLPVFGADEAFLGYRGTGSDVTEQRQAEDARRESEEKYRSVFERTDVALSQVRISDGGIIEANHRAAEVLGYRDAEEMKREFVAERHWADPSQRERLLADVMAKGSVGDREVEFIRRDGSQGWQRVSVTSFPDRDYLVAVALDITERKQIEEALRESEERYRSIFSSAQVGLIRSRISDGKPLEVNDRLAEILGYESREDAIANHRLDNHWLRQSDREAWIAEGKRNGFVRDFDGELIRKDGSIVPIRSSATFNTELDFVDVMMLDQSEQKRAE